MSKPQFSLESSIAPADHTCTARWDFVGGPVIMDLSRNADAFEVDKIVQAAYLEGQRDAMEEVISEGAFFVERLKAARGSVS